MFLFLFLFLANAHLHHPQPFMTFKSLIKNYQSQRSSAFTKDFWDPAIKFENLLNCSLSIKYTFFHRKGNPNLPQRNTQHFFHSSCVPAPLIPLFQHSLRKNKERRRMRRISLNTGRSDDFWEVPDLALRASHDLWRCSRCPVPTSTLRNVGTTTSCYFQPWESFIPSSFNPNNPLQIKFLSPHTSL